MTKTINDMVHRRSSAWRGPSDGDGYDLPHNSLGWQAIAIANQHEVELTPAEKREVLWAYAINDLGDRLFDEEPPESVQRVDAAIGSRLVFRGWASYDIPEIGVAQGEPIGYPEHDAPTPLEVAAEARLTEGGE